MPPSHSCTSPQTPRAHYRERHISLTSLLSIQCAPSSWSHSATGTPTALTRSLDQTCAQTTDTCGSPLTDRNKSRKGKTMTIYPLLLPPPGKPSLSAHDLTSLYFHAILGSRHIPEYSAEYISMDGQYNSILLLFNDSAQADYLKEMWDSIDRENSSAPGLAEISLYRGNTCAKYTDTSVRDAAFDELASYALTSWPQTT